MNLGLRDGLQQTKVRFNLIIIYFYYVSFITVVFFRFQTLLARVKNNNNKNHGDHAAGIMIGYKYEYLKSHFVSLKVDQGQQLTY